MGPYGPASKRNLTFNLLDPDQIRLTLCQREYFLLFMLKIVQLDAVFLTFCPQTKYLGPFL